MEVCPKFYSRTHGQAWSLPRSMSTSISLSLTALLALSLPSIQWHLFWFTGKTSWCNLITKSPTDYGPGDWAWGVSRKSFKTKHVVFISFWHVSTCFNNAPMDPSLIPHISHLPTNPILDPRDIHRGVPRCIATSALLKPRRQEIHRLDNPQKNKEIRVMLQQNPPWH